MENKMEKSDIMVSSTHIGETNDMTITHIPTGIAVRGYAERMLEHRPLRERLMRELEEKFQHYMANLVER